MNHKTFLKKAQSLGWPHANLRVEIQFTKKNSALCQALGKDSEPEIYKLVDIEDRGVIIGEVHKQLIEWKFVNKIL